MKNKIVICQTRWHIEVEMARWIEVDKVEMMKSMDAQDGVGLQTAKGLPNEQQLGIQSRELSIGNMGIYI